MLKRKTPKITQEYSASRFRDSMTAASNMSCILHIALSIFYFIIEVPEMLIYNVFGFFLFLALRQLFKANWIKTPFILGSLNVVLGICLADYFIGWEANFNIYLILLPASILIYSGWKIWETSLYLTILAAIYLSLFLLLSNSSPVYAINSEILKYLSIANTVAAISILLVILGHLNSSIILMTKKLEDKNTQLEHQRDELDQKVIERTTKLRQLNKNLVENESKFSAFFENGAIGMLILNQDGTFDSINEALYNILGFNFERKELRDAYYFDIIMPDKNNLGEFSFETILNKDTNFTSQYKGKNNNTIWANTTISSVTNNKGEIINLMILIEDLTDARIIEQERNRLFNNSKDLICVINSLGKIESANPAFLNTLGHKEEKLASIGWTTLIHPDDLELSLKNLDTIMLSDAGLNFENRYLCASNDYKWLSWNIVQDVDTSKIFAVARDITNQMIDRKTLENANADLKQFAYIATHDLKVPVDNILGCYNILLHDIENHSDKTKLIMPWIKKSLDQASSIISQLIQLEKAGVDYQDQESLQLEDTIQHVLNYFSAKITSINAEIVTDFSACDTLYYSKSTFNSIAQNLISNALKYHSPDRRCRITIKTKLENEFFCFSIEDNGVGIDLENQRKKLFGLFQRISTIQDGSGLGLYMIKKLIENNGGRIDVESQVGKGSVFYVYIKAHQ